MSKPVNPPGLTIPPGADELPSEDGVPLETNRHRLEMNLLCDALDRHLATRRPDYFVGGNMFFYFSLLQTRKNDFRGPDVFVALGVEHRDRKSWAMWEEDGKAPDVIIELTSESTAEEDHGPKRHVYARLHVPEYFIYDPLTCALEGYRLDIARGDYRPATPTAHGRLASLALSLELGPWDGTYRGFSGPWLRWFHPSGEPVLLAEEAEVEERRLREEERRLREEAERKLAEMIGKLERHRG